MRTFSRGLRLLCLCLLSLITTASAQPLGGGSSPLPDVTRTGGGLEARQNGTLVWRLSFPAGSGATTEPLFNAGRLYVGHGNSVLRLEPRTGDVEARALVSGPVERLARVDDATVAVTVRHSPTLGERFTLRGDTVREPVRFGTTPRTFGYLRAEANVSDPAARLGRDPTNPWLYLALGLRENEPEAARARFAEAVAAATTFYDLARIATVLEARGERALAARAFDAAMRDFAGRGYDPRLLRDGGLEAAYNFPLTSLKAALAEDDDLSAEFWAERLILAAPNVPGATKALSAYAALAREVAPPDEAAVWERRAALSKGDQNALDRAVTTLAQGGWAVALALLVAFLALHLTLFVKYAPARRADRARWLFAVRYLTLSETFVLLLLLTATLACAALGGWYGGLRALPVPVTGSGTLLNRAAQVYLAELSGPDAAAIRGYAALVAGDSAEARVPLQRAGEDASALNNLGVLTGDAELYRQALVLLPDLAAARYNLGDAATKKALLPFQARYLNEPALATPSADAFQSATVGTWQTALARAFTRPQENSPTAPYGLSPALWYAARLTLLLVVFVHVVFLFVPRPRSARDAPRPWGYELLALLVPGSGLADEAWGVFLLVPWAVFGLETLSRLLGWGVELGLAPTTLWAVLAGIYLLNTVAVTVEGMSYRQGRRVLARRRTDARRA